MDRSLHDFIHQTGRVEAGTLFKISIDIALAMFYLHGQRCFHRDLNSKNILLDDSRNAKLADFGLSKFKQTDVPLSNTMGAVAWMAPEILRNAGDFSAASDVYSFAIVLWEMLTGLNPNQVCTHTYSHFEFAQKVFAGYRPPFTNPGTQPSPSDRRLQELIEHCWAKQPTDRLTVGQILSHLRSFQWQFQNPLPPSFPAPVVMAPTTKQWAETSDVTGTEESYSVSINHYDHEIGALCDTVSRSGASH